MCIRDRAKLAADADATQTIGVSGTPLYMSPEQAEGKVLDARSDVFSFGAALYELLAGQRAFDSLASVLRDEPRTLQVPAELRSIVARCLRKNVEERFPSIAEAKAALEQVRLTPEQQPSIAVLPFANMSGDKEQEYFSDGLAEEILNLLAKIPALKEMCIRDRSITFCLLLVRRKRRLREDCTTKNGRAAATNANASPMQSAGASYRSQSLVRTRAPFAAY